MELTKSYQYLDTLLMRIMNYPYDLTWKVDEYNLSGSRHSGKTTSIAIELAKIITAVQTTDIKVAIYPFRYYSRQVNELVNEVKIALDHINIKYSYTKYNKTFLFANGSFIKVLSVYTPTGNVNLKGESGVDAKYIIKWVEEANELKQVDFQNIDFSIRSKNKDCEYINISTCNPDLIYQYHIKYLNDSYMFDESILKTQNEQFAIKNINGFRKLYHYTNWKVNPFVSEGVKLKLEELLILDPIKAKPWYWGLPGALSGTIFSHYLENKESRLLFTPNKFVGGGDFGISDSPLGHPITAVLIGVNYDNTKYHVMKEFYHSNSEMAHKNVLQLANDFVEFYLKAIEEFRINQPITIYCDYGGGGLPFIQIVEQIIRDNMLSNKLNIVKVDKSKWFLKDRIDITQMLLAKKDLSWDDNICPKLTETMNMIKYKEVKNEETYKPEMVDLYDDLWDAMCYALMNLVSENINKITNPMLVHKALLRKHLGGNN